METETQVTGPLCCPRCEQLSSITGGICSECLTRAKWSLVHQGKRIIFILREDSYLSNLFDLASQARTPVLFREIVNIISLKIEEYIKKGKEELQEIAKRFWTPVEKKLVMIQGFQKKLYRLVRRFFCGWSEEFPRPTPFRRTWEATGW